MDEVLDIKVAKNMEVKFNKISKKLDLDPLNLDESISNRLFHQKPNLPYKNNFFK